MNKDNKADKDNEDPNGDEDDDDKREDEKNDPDILQELENDDSNSKHATRFGHSHEESNDPHEEKFEDAIEAPAPKGRISFGRKHAKNGHEEPTPEKEEIQWFSEPEHQNGQRYVSYDENEFIATHFWKQENRFNADDVLNDIA